MKYQITYLPLDPNNPSEPLVEIIEADEICEVRGLVHFKSKSVLHGIVSAQNVRSILITKE